MAKAIHSCIRVLDEARSVAFYETALRFQVAEKLDFPEFSLIYLSNPESAFELELTVNKGTTAPYDLGNGYAHFAVSVEDLEAEHARMTAAGLLPGQIVDFAPAGARVARFFFLTDPDGYKIEVIERGGRFL